MNLNDYQKAAARTIPDGYKASALFDNAILGLNGESGELADMTKKWRFQGHLYTQLDWIDEAGDVLWYLAALATSLGVTLEQVAEHNVEKLRKRYPNGFNENDSINRQEYTNGGGIADTPKR